jgi:putative addiction module component (TIGR02574 family)
MPVSSRVLERLRKEALELSAAERAELAHDLVSSLDGPVDPRAAQEWEAEIQRRMDEIESGTATLIDRKDFAHRMRERLSRL